ncbi:rhombosortase [Acidobacteria bacterium AH-259-G07]|nr:rhombosortase [Acidobacteria bacterium AH-259-G07]
MIATSNVFWSAPARRIPCASLLLATAAVVIALAPSAAVWLEYDRVAIEAGELWRAVFCHWTHVSADHLLWDLLMFVALGALCEQASRGRFCACILSSAVLIPLAIWIALPELTTYRGLSGIDSSLFALLAVMELKDGVSNRCWLRVMALSAAVLLFIGKTSYEIVTGTTLFVDSAALVPIPLAHVVGAAVGFVVGFVKLPDRIFLAHRAPTY